VTNPGPDPLPVGERGRVVASGDGATAPRSPLLQESATQPVFVISPSSVFASVLAVAAIAATTLRSPAQERGFWVANLNSDDVMEVAPWGGVLRRVDMGKNVRGTHLAPDGRVWIVGVGTTDFDVLDPATGALTTLSSPVGNPYDIAFDAQGDAWVSGGSGVAHFDAAGALVQGYPLTELNPLGITIDGLGNKWIVHRNVAGSVTRIDAAGVVSNFPVSAANPVRPIADFRGVLAPSHIWISCDAGPVLELDENGNELNSYDLPSNTIGGVGPAFDRSGDIWVGDYATGAVYQLDPTNGSVRNTFDLAPHANGLTVDTQGNILVVQRITYSGIGPACQVRRLNPATGAIEVVTDLELDGAVGLGSSDAADTPFHYAMVTAPNGDADGDGDSNFDEIQNGTAPFDASSSSDFSVASVGVSTAGGSVDFVVTSNQLWVLGFSPAMLAAGVPVANASGLLQIDGAQLVTTAQGVGSATLSLPIPISGALVGYEMFCQGLILAGGQVEFRNVSGIRIW